MRAHIYYEKCRNSIKIVFIASRLTCKMCTLFVSMHFRLWIFFLYFFQYCCYPSEHYGFVQILQMRKTVKLFKNKKRKPRDRLNFRVVDGSKTTKSAQTIVIDDHFVSGHGDDDNNGSNTRALLFFCFVRFRLFTFYHFHSLFACAACGICQILMNHDVYKIMKTSKDNQ